jgi:RNase P subunit RPR2
MSQGKSDGKNPKFRILCRRCNSYLHTVVHASNGATFGEAPRLHIFCNKCANTAETFEEEVDDR